MGLLKLHLFRAVALSLLGILLLVVFRDSGHRRRPVDARYIFTLFDGVKDLYVYTSPDAKNWTRYAGPTYTPEKGELRDPSIIYHTECVLHVFAYRGSADAVCLAGNTISLVRLLSGSSSVSSLTLLQDTTGWFGTDFAIAVRVADSRRLWF
jgi:hypothetical protein